MIFALLIGIFIGFISAIPVAGPISAMVFSYGMTRRYKEGRWLAAGAGIAESCYCFIAFVGFQHLFKDLTFLMKATNLLTVFILVFLGIYFYRSKKMRAHHDTQVVPAVSSKAFLIGLSVALANLTLLATWSAFMPSLSALKVFEFNYPNFFIFSAGVALGVYLWFTLLLVLIAKHRDRFEESILDKILKSVSFLLWGIAVWMLIRF